MKKQKISELLFIFYQINSQDKTYIKFTCSSLLLQNITKSATNFF